MGVSPVTIMTVNSPTDADRQLQSFRRRRWNDGCPVGCWSDQKATIRVRHPLSTSTGGSVSLLTYRSWTTPILSYSNSAAADERRNDSTSWSVSLPLYAKPFARSTACSTRNIVSLFCHENTHKHYTVLSGTPINNWRILFEQSFKTYMPSCRRLQAHLGSGKDASILYAIFIPQTCTHKHQNQVSLFTADVITCNL